MIAVVTKFIDDQTFEVYLEMKHPTSVKTKIVLEPYIRALPNMPSTEFQKALAKAISVQDNDLLNEILILGQVKAWSFGAVTKEVLDNEVSENMREKILAMLNEMYAPLATSGLPQSLETSTLIG